MRAFRATAEGGAGGARRTEAVYSVRVDLQPDCLRADDELTAALLDDELGLAGPDGSNLERAELGVAVRKERVHGPKRPR